MRPMLAACLAVSFAVTALPALPNGKNPGAKMALEFRETAREYRQMGRKMKDNLNSFNGGQRGQASKLADVYNRLAAIKEELADAAGGGNWKAFDQAEKRYYKVKKQEQALSKALGK